MNKDAQSPNPFADLVQRYAMREYGRRLSPERALEISEEVRCYERAIGDIATTQEINNEPSTFLETLVRLRAIDIE